MKLKILLTLLLSLSLTGCGGGGGSSNTAPILENIASQSVDEDNSKTVAIAATDADNDSLTYSATSSASEVGVGVSGNVITLTPVLNWNGTSTITAKVNDGTVDSTTQIFTLTVSAINDSPEVSTSIPDSSASLGSTFSLDTSNYITDPDTGDSLNFIALLSDNSSLPNWLSINQTSGVLSGSPVSSAASISVKVTATDTSNASIADTFLLTVPTTVVWNYGGWNDLIWGIESSADDSVWGNDNWNSKKWQ